MDDGVSRTVLESSEGAYSRICNLAERKKDNRKKELWLNVTSGLVTWLLAHQPPLVNDYRAGAHNSAKPLHEACLSRLGLQVPASIPSSNVNALKAFALRGLTIIKTLSGVSADCGSITAEDLESYVPSQGPVHLQRRTFSYNIRVDSIGSMAFAVLFKSTELDYRAARNVSTAQSRQLLSALVCALNRASRALGLTFVGWDFKIDTSGVFWLLEVNPMPACHDHGLLVNGEFTKEINHYLELGLYK